MTLLEMIQCLTPNVCKANNCNENDIAQILMLAYKFNKEEIDHHIELANNVLSSIERLKGITENKVVKFRRFDELGNLVEEKKELDVPEFLKNRRKK